MVVGIHSDCIYHCSRSKEQAREVREEIDGEESNGEKEEQDFSDMLAYWCLEGMYVRECV
jgi:hypothetical protein